MDRQIEMLNAYELRQAFDLGRDMAIEVERARSNYPRFASAHEGWGVLREEYKELEAEIMKKDMDRASMRKEAIQVGAMAIRIIQDCCEPLCDRCRREPAEWAGLCQMCHEAECSEAWWKSRCGHVEPGKE